MIMPKSNFSKTYNNWKWSILLLLITGIIAHPALSSTIQQNISARLLPTITMITAISIFTYMSIKLHIAIRTTDVKT
ncbi:MAG: cytochrome b subunit of formate dehydrogenase [Alphaproteobacteria bacterium]|jgi:cytochrome b subunit of formate dehydrogenase